MPDPTSTGFIPKWLRDQPLDENEPHFLAGSIPDSDPRVVTRLVPKDHKYGLPARTVSRVIDLKQNLVYYAAFEVQEGPKPGFADLSAVSRSLREAATLVLEPAEPGSFVIPARLPDRKDFNADAVVARYAQLLAAIDDGRMAAEVCTGALQVCREFGNLLRKEVDSIEVTTYDRENAPRPPYKFTTGSIQRLDRLLEGRRGTSRTAFEKLTGRLEAVDLAKNVFHLKLPESKRRVKGSAASIPIKDLGKLLGMTVTLEGDVVREHRSITMTVHRVIDGEDE